MVKKRKKTSVCVFIHFMIYTFLMYAPYPSEKKKDSKGLNGWERQLFVTIEADNEKRA